MITFLDPPADHLLAARIDGTVTGADLDAFERRLDAALARHDRLSVYLEVEGVRSMEPAAILKDLRLGVRGLGQLGRFHRAAVVTDAEWIRTVASWEGGLLRSVEVRTFPAAEREAALAWASEAPPPREPEGLGTERLPTDRPGLVAFRVHGPLTGADVDAIGAAVEAASGEGERVRLLLRFDADRGPGVRFSALKGRLGRLRREVLRSVDRYAVVGGPDWVESTLEMMDPLVRVRIRHFERDEEDAAWAWVREEGGEPPAVERLGAPIRGVAAFAIRGRLEATDYTDTILPTLEGILADNDRVDLFLRFDRFGGASLGALRQDVRMTPLASRMRRVALVGAPAWIESAARLFTPFLPLTLRAFDDEDDAWGWLRTPPA